MSIKDEPSLFNAKRWSKQELSKRAVAYVRMSTDQQKYSTENQLDAINKYAVEHGMEVVRTFADEGKSGLKIKGREALQNMIAEVETGKTDFGVILVLDVTRWGRFQNPDESAFYEFMCQRAGINVQYVAEQFQNDGSRMASMFKGMKRLMAGEYPSELSGKVFAGACRLVGYGFRQGGSAGYGLRRMMLNEQRQPKMELKRGERKSLQTDRVILVHGPEEEVKNVRWMYQAFVDERLPESQIAAILNQKGVKTDFDRPWTRGTVHEVLINEKYAGHNVYNRKSYKLKEVHVKNPPEKWVRAENAFEAIVEPAYFLATQHLIQQRNRRFTNEEMLSLLKNLYERKGWLSGIVINEEENMPSSAAYAHRFGGLVSAYKLIGYDPCIDYSYQETNKHLRSLFPEIEEGVIKGLHAAGGRATHDLQTPLIIINDEMTVSVVIARCQRTKAGSLRWKIRLDTGLRPDFTIAVRMDAENKEPMDYYVLPAIDVENPKLRLAEENGFALDTYRFESLEPFYQLAERVALPVAA